jgi:hypothetical protein
MHVEQVLGDVPPTERCTCREKSLSGSAEQPSVLQRIFDRMC